MTAAGRQELALPPAQRASQRQHPDSLAVEDPGDVAADRDGVLYVLSREEQRAGCYRFGQDGRSLGAFSVGLEEPAALAISADDTLVAGRGSSKLVWYTHDGSEIGRAPAELALGAPSGLAVAANGDFSVADPAEAHVLRLSSRLSPLGS